MGSHREDDDERAKKAASLTKKNLSNFWLGIRETASDHSSLDLRSTANLIGFTLFPVGWTWEEYPPNSNSCEMAYEKKGKKACRLGIKVGEPITKAGSKAHQNGAKYRKQKVERILRRMIKREEIAVTCYNYAQQGFPLSDRVRLDETAAIDIENNTVGLQNMTPDSAVYFEADLLQVLEALEARKRKWETNRSEHDWLKMERYLRDLYQANGIPKRLDDYSEKTMNWTSQREPYAPEANLAKLRALTTSLRNEYSDS